MRLAVIPVVEYNDRWATLDAREEPLQRTRAGGVMIGEE